jgi:protease-4
MGQFFKFVLATFVGILLFVFLWFIFLLGLGSLMSAGDSGTEIKEKAVLKLNFNGQFIDLKQPEDPFKDILGNGVNSISLRELNTALENAALDPNVKGISIHLDDPQMGFAELDEVKQGLTRFKKSGKFIYTFSEYLSEKAVLIAAVADSAFIHPQGSVEFNGLSSEVTFLTGTLEKLGVEPVIFRVGEFKSAVEPFFRKNLSEENKLQMNSYMGSIASNIYGDFAKTKNMSQTAVDSILNAASILNTKDAIKYKLVHAEAYADQYEAAIRQKISVKKDAKINFVGLNSYAAAKKYVTESKSSDRVAVIVSEGEIVQGENSEGVLGSDDFIKELRRARKDKKVKAVVVRINSPGGSAMASDMMWREIQLTRQEKPVIASMGDVAASGGYYMAMACDTIVAHPTTITGSIGIFGVMMNVQKLMNDKLGIYFDGVKTHDFADSPSGTRKMSEVEIRTIQNMVNEGYEDFTAKAAQGRKMSVEKLRSLAGGRVWTGAQAKENGLVDVLGDLNSAIAIAAKKAKIEDYQVKYYPFPKSEFDRIVDRISKKGEDTRVMEYLGQFGPVYQQLKTLSRMDKVQARMEYLPEIR